MLLTDKAKAAALRAADWLEANPDRHTRGSLARNAYGAATTPTSPTAVCFCALGRLAHEVGADTTDYDGIRTATGMTYDQTEDVWRTNDHDPDDTNCGNPAVIPLLRKLGS